MTDLQKEFEATGYTSWINSDLYPDGKIYTQEYTEWLEKQVQALRIALVVREKEQLKAFVDWWHGLSQEELAWYEGRYVEVFLSL